MNVCIVGGGVTGALAALYMQKHCPEWTVTLLENPKIKALPVGENMHRHTFKFFCDIVDQPWRTTMRELIDLNCTIKLAGLFTGWSDIVDPFYVALFTENSNEDIMKMHNAWLAANKDRPLTEYYDMVYGDVMHHVRDFTIPNDYMERAPELCCVTVDASQISGYLKNKFKGNIIYGHVVGFERDSENLKSVRLEDGSTIEADLFIDCTGFHRVIIKEFAKFKPIESSMVNAAYAGHAKYANDKIPVYTDLATMNHGWMFRIPMQHRCGIGYVFNRDYIDMDVMEHEHELYGGESIGEKTMLRWESVQTSTPWSNNVLSLGIAAFWNEPFLGTGLEVSCRSIINFVKLFKEAGYAGRDHYNDWFTVQADLINTRILSMYHYCKDNHTDFWKHVHEKSSKTDIEERMLYLSNGGFSEMLKQHPNLMWSQRDWEVTSIMLGIDGFVPDKKVDNDTLLWAQNKWKQNLVKKPSTPTNDFYAKLK